MPPLVFASSVKYAIGSQGSAVDGDFDPSTFALAINGFLNRGSTTGDYGTYPYDMRSPYIDEFVVDSKGNIYTIVSARVLGGCGQYDIIVSRFYNNGNHAWSKVIGTSMYEVPGAIALDASDNVYVAFGAGAVESSNQLISSDAAVLIKMSHTGSILWTSEFSETTFIFPDTLRVTASGVYIGCRVASMMYINIVKCSLADGSLLWNKAVYKTTNPVNSGVACVATDTLDNVYHVGSATSPSSSSPLYMSKHTSLGVLEWTVQTATYYYPTGLCTASDGSLCTCGWNATAGLISKWSSSGSLQWTSSLKPASGSISIRTTSIATDSAGNVYVAGTRFSSASRNPPTAYVAKFSASGVLDWQKELSGITTGTSGLQIGADNMVYWSVAVNIGTNGTFAAITDGGKYTTPYLLKLASNGSTTGSFAGLSLVDATLTTPAASYTASSQTFSQRSDTLTYSSKPITVQDLEFNGGTVGVQYATTGTSRIQKYCHVGADGNTYLGSSVYGSTGFYIQKFSPAGALLLTISYPAAYVLLGMLADASGNLYVTAATSTVFSISGYNSSGTKLFEKNRTLSSTSLAGDTKMSISGTTLKTAQTAYVSAYKGTYLTDINLSTNAVSAAHIYPSSFTMANSSAPVGIFLDSTNVSHMFMQFGTKLLWRTADTNYATIDVKSFDNFTNASAAFINDTFYITGVLSDAGNKYQTIVACASDRSVIWRKSFPIDTEVAYTWSGSVCKDADGNLWWSLLSGLIKINGVGDITYYPIPMLATTSLSVADNFLVISSTSNFLTKLDLGTIHLLEDVPSFTDVATTLTISNVTPGTTTNTIGSWTTGNTGSSLSAIASLLTTTVLNAGISTTKSVL